MSRAYLIILILHLGLISQGCTALEYLDGSSKEEIKEFKMTKDEMHNEIERLKTENVDLQSQINTLREENQKIRDENEKETASMRDENEVLNEQINKLKEEGQRISDENQILAKKLTSLQIKYETISSESDESKKDIGKLKIKVLSGDGNLNSAKEMAKRLMKIGCKIGSIHYAPRSNFSRDTVYFAPKFQDDAKWLLPNLGSNAISKPLTWPSIFDLIVVTGKTP
ncbi:MAG: hypothetical protein JSU78_05410 [Deltaproteobacteria bacterium]|nr:MAG: hypothetical protein JSU78_05410 [Deltaproteobacteria bacterium]